MNEDSRNHRILMALLSLVFMGGVGMAAFSIIPIIPRILGTGQPDVAYTTLGTINANAGDGPVFTLGDDFFPHQCGKARLTPSGNLSLFAYQEINCRKEFNALHPYLLAADLRVPWAVVPPSERNDLSRLAGVVMGQWEVVAHQLIQSAFFRQYYAPVIKDILQNAFRQAWTSLATEHALTQAVKTFDRSQLNRLFEGILPIFLEKAKNNFWQTLGSYASVMLGNDNQEVMAKLGAEVLADPRTQAYLMQIFPPLLTNREVMIVGAVMAREALRAIFEDPRSLPLAGRLLADQRFLSLQPFSAELEQFIRALPMRLMRLRRRFDHNPLATFILRNMVRGRRGFLVLMLSAQQEQQLVNSDLPAGPALRRIEP